MASVLLVDKLDPQSGTALEIGTSGDTITVPSGATLDISASTLTPPATMPASSGINFTALNATNLGSGTVPTARLGSGTASSSTVLYGDQTYKTEPTGGKILQVTSTQFTSYIATSSASYVTANVDHAITTTALNSKLWVLYTFEMDMFQNSDQRMGMCLKSSDDTYSAELTDAGGRARGTVGNGNTSFQTAMSYLHNPTVAASTTITYRVMVKLESGSDDIGIGGFGGNTVATVMEVSA